MDTNQIKCLNCEELFEEGCNFCPKCGQKTNEDLTVGVLFYNTISNYFSFDARFLKSFFPLMFKPGYLAKRFVGGKRLLYLHPAQMYLFVSVIFFFVFSFTVNDWIVDANKATQNINDTNLASRIDDKSKKSIDSILKNALQTPIKIANDSAYYNAATEKAVDSIINAIKKNDYNSNINFGISKKRLDSLRQVGATEDEILQEIGMNKDAGIMSRGFYKSMLDLSDGKGVGNLIKRFADTIPIAMFFLLPLFALMLKVFYFKRGRYAYHLVFSFYFFSFLFTVFTIVLAINRFVTFIEIPLGVSWLIVLSTFVYFYLALLNFYKRNWFTTLLKSGVITFMFLMMVIPFAAAIIGAFAVIDI